MTKTNTPRRRSFAPKAAQTEPIIVELFEQDFKAHADIPGVVILDFAAASESGQTVLALTDFLSKALLPEDYERFNKVIHDPETIVPIETIGEIVAFLIEEYTGRPLAE